MNHSQRAMRILLLPHILLLCVSSANCAQRSAEPPFTLKHLGPSVWAAIDNPKALPSSGANAGFVIGEDGVAVIDTFASVEAAKQLLAEIRKVTKAPVKFVINTHHHFDHVSGNGVFVDAGAGAALIVTHEAPAMWQRVFVASRAPRRILQVVFQDVHNVAVQEVDEDFPRAALSTSATSSE